MDRLGHMRRANDEMRKESGWVNDTRPLVAFLYTLLRDAITPGKVEEIIEGSDFEGIGRDGCQFTNGWLARYAQNVAERLTAHVSPLYRTDKGPETTSMTTETNRALDDSPPGATGLTALECPACHSLVSFTREGGYARHAADGCRVNGHAIDALEAMGATEVCCPGCKYRVPSVAGRVLGHVIHRAGVRVECKMLAEARA
jgi:hypothetical protein